MSTTVEHRVLEMKFDNAQFERNAATTMSTLEKLKQKLSFKGATKGLEDVSVAANRVDMSGLSGGINTVMARFSALDVVGTTALVRLTNSAINAGNRIVKALTIEPVMTGFSEYETKINSIQTIMSNTASKGTTMEDVTRVIGELNTYADKTIYNFAEMTRNIGTFTAAGVGLEESAAAIKGIANLAAASGSTSQQASTAMYQLSQALAAGTVKLMDWNSVVNAGMGGEKFQEALKQTAREHGVAVDAMIKKNGSFRESLQEGWISADILNETLNKFTVDGAKAYAQSMLESGKYTKEQADALVKEATAMEEAATKVKTFTQLWDTMKESVQSGWGQTWELLVGDFEEAKEFLSGLSDTFGKAIDAFSNARNELLAGALNSKWEKLVSKVEAAGISTETFNAKLKETLTEGGYSVDKLVEEYGSLKKAFKAGKVPAEQLTKTIKKLVGVVGTATENTEEFGKVVDDVIAGKFGNGQNRIKALTEAGYDYNKVQDQVNEKLGSSVRHYKALTEEQKNSAEQLANLSRSQLLAKGYTLEQIWALKELKKAAEQGGTSINDLIDTIEQPGGRELLIESVHNALEAIGKILGTVKAAWTNVFGDNKDAASTGLYSFIEGFAKLTDSMKISETAAENLEKIVTAMLSLFKLTAMTMTFGLTSTLRLIKAVLSLFDMNMMDAVSVIADWVTKCVEWIEKNTIFINMIDKIARVLETIIYGIGDVIDAFKELQIVEDIITSVTTMFDKLFGSLSLDFNGFSVDGIVKTIQDAFAQIVDWVKSLDTNEAARNVVDGLCEGLTNGIPKIWDTMLELANTIITSICDALGIESPSRVLMGIGAFAVAGFVIGIQNGLTDVQTVVTTFVNKCIEIFGDIDWGALLTAGFVGGTLMIGNKLVKVLDKFASIPDKFAGILSSIAGMFTKIGGMFDAIGDSFKAKKWETRTAAILNFAKAVLMLAAAVALLTIVDPTKLWSAVGAISALMAVLVGLTYLAGNMNTTVSAIKQAGLGAMLMTIAASIFVLALAIRMLANVDGNVDSATKALAGIVASLISILLAVSMIAKYADLSENIGKLGWVMLGMSVSILIMGRVIKQLAEMNDQDIAKGLLAIAGIEVLFVAFMLLTKRVDGNGKIGGTLLKMSGAILLVAVIVKIISKLNPEDLIKGLAVVAAIGAVFYALIRVCSKYDAESRVVGGALLKMAAAMLTLTIVMRLISGMKVVDMAKGLAAIAVLGAVITGLVKAINLASDKELKRVGTTILAMSLAIGALAISTALLGLMKVENLVKGVAAVAVLSTFMAGMIMATKGAADVKGTMIGLAVAIGVMAGAIAILALIPDTSKLAAATGAMVGVMLSFAVMAKMAGNVQGSMKTLIVMVAAIGVMAGALYLLASLPIESTVSAAVSLGALLLAMAAAMSIVSTATSISKSGLIGMGVMTLVVGALAFILKSLSELPVESSLGIAAGLSLLLISMSIACAIVSAIPLPAAIAGTAGLAVFIGGLALVLTALGELCDAEIIQNGAGVLAEIGYALGDFIGSIIGGFSAGIMSGMPDIAENLSAFMKNLQGFIDGAKSIDSSTIESVESLAKAVLVLTAAEFINAIGMFRTSSLTEFGEEVSGFINALSGIDTFSEDQITTIKNASDAIEIAAEASQKVNGQSGFSKWAFGDNSLSVFAESIKSFISSLSSMGTFTKDQEQTVTRAGDALGVIADAANKVPDQGTKLWGIFGDTSLATFAESIKTFVSTLAGMGTFTKDQVTTVENAADAIEVAAKASNKIDGQAEWAKSWFGDNSLSTFATSIKSFISTLADMGTFTKDQVNTIENAGKGIKALTEAAKGIDGQANWSKSVFGDNSLSAFAEDIKSFVTTIGTLDTTALVNFSETLTELGETTVDDFIEGFTGSETKVENAASDIADSATDAIEKKKSNFKTAGKCVVEGFADGIEFYSYISNRAARVMANAAADAANAALEVNSPSKVFRRIGSAIPEGFAQGIGMFGDDVTRASQTMTKTAMNSAKKSLEGLVSMMSSEVDTQPTIRPILDLSDVRDKASTVASLFNNGPAVGVTANLAHVSTAMNTPRDAGNSEVVSAINKLRSDLGNIGNTYNTIESITYDDGSNVSEAIETLVRASIRERRV